MTHSHCTATVAAIVIFASHLLSNPAFAQSTRSSIDIQREDAAAVFGPRLAALSMMRAQAAADRHRYEVACKNKKTTIHPKSVPGIPLGTVPLYPLFPETLETKNETTPTCRILRDDVNTRSAFIAAELSTIDEDARRWGTIPGIMRDLKAAYGLGLQR